MMKACLRCKVEKPEEDFYWDRRTTPHRRRGVCIACMKPEYAARQSRYRAEGRVNDRKHNLARMGITEEQYEEMLERQGGVCAICEKPPGRRRLAVDHDHECCPPSATNPQAACGNCNRGLLCDNCNTKLAWLEKYEERAALYLAMAQA